MNAAEQNENAGRDRRELSLRAKLSLPEAAAAPWGALGAAAALGSLLLCLLVLGPALASLLLGNQASTPLLLLLSWALGMGIAAGFVSISRRSSAASWQALQFTRGNLPLPLALLHGIGIALTIDLVISLSSGAFLPIPELVGFLAAAPASLILAALLVIVLQPIAETLVFQAQLLPALRWRLGAWRGLLLTCAVYIAVHTAVFSAAYAGQPQAFWHTVVYPALLCCFSCMLKVYAQSSLSVLVARMSAGLIFYLTAFVLFAG